jgi:hypothetical protein
MTEIVASPVQLDLPHIKFTPYAVEFEGRPTPTEWLQALNAVNRVHSMCQFYLGDLVAHAEYEWGHKYTELIEATGYEYNTLARYAGISRRFTPSFREAVFGTNSKNPSGLSFTHFFVAAPLDDEHALYFLEMCRDAGWTVARLREEIKRWQSGEALLDKLKRKVIIDERRKEASKLLGSMLSDVWVIDADWVSVQIGRGNEVLGEQRKEIGG